MAFNKYFATTFNKNSKLAPAPKGAVGQTMGAYKAPTVNATAAKAQMAPASSPTDWKALMAQAIEQVRMRNTGTQMSSAGATGSATTQGGANMGVMRSAFAGPTGPQGGTQTLSASQMPAQYRQNPQYQAASTAQRQLMPAQPAYTPPPPQQGFGLKGMSAEELRRFFGF